MTGEISDNDLVYVSQYQRLQQYGGPEEGGWWVSIHQYTEQSLGPFRRSQAMIVQKAANTAANSTHGLLAARHLGMGDIFYFLEEVKGEHHQEWGDLPNEAWYYH